MGRHSGLIKLDNCGDELKNVEQLLSRRLQSPGDIRSLTLESNTRLRLHYQPRATATFFQTGLPDVIFGGFLRRQRSDILHRITLLCALMEWLDCLISGSPNRTSDGYGAWRLLFQSHDVYKHSLNPVGTCLVVKSILLKFYKTDCQMFHFAHFLPPETPSQRDTLRVSLTSSS